MANHDIFVFADPVGFHEHTVKLEGEVGVAKPLPPLLIIFTEGAMFYTPSNNNLSDETDSILDFHFLLDLAG